MNHIRKILLIVVWLYFPFYVSSQNFISEHKLWRNGAKIYSEPCCGHRNDSYKFLGDSTINDTTYAILLTTPDEYLNNWQFHTFWRETEDNKIFLRHTNSQFEELFYDFSLNVGDTFDAQGLELKVESVKILNWGGKLRKHWYLNPVSGDQFHHTLWIEGVGQINNFTKNVNGSVGSENYLICFEEDGQLVFHNTDYPDCVYTQIRGLNYKESAIELTPTNNGIIEIRLKPDSNGELTFYTTDGQIVLKKTVNSFKTRLCLPTCSILLYRYVNQYGETNTGKIIVK